MVVSGVVQRLPKGWVRGIGDSSVMSFSKVPKISPHICFDMMYDNLIAFWYVKDVWRGEHTEGRQR